MERESPDEEEEFNEEITAVIECPHCGETSTLPELFSPIWTGFGRGELLCPRCRERWQEGFSRWTFILGLPLAIVGSLIWLKGKVHPGLLIGGLALAAFFTILLTALHELAHALAAMALRMRVYWVVIGLHGRPLYQCRLGGCLIQVNRWPLRGNTTASGPGTRFLRLRRFLIALAGPLLHVVMLLFAYWLIEWMDKSHAQWVWLSRVAMVFAWINICQLGLNLLPWRVRGSAGDVCSDGYLLLTIPFEPEEKTRAFPVYYFISEPGARSRRKDFDGAIECVDEGLKRYPGYDLLRAGYGIVSMVRGDFDAAVRQFEEVRRLPAVTPQLDAMFRSDIAYCDVASGRSDLERALEYSRVAMEAMPWSPAFRSTRGCVLVLAGEIDEGIELLLDVWKENEPADARACVAAMLAIGAVRQQRHDDAFNWLRKAEKLDPHCQLLDRARREYERG